MKQEINLDPIKIILDKLQLENQNVYLGLDFLLLVKKLKPKNLNLIETTEFILDCFQKRLGKFGNLIIPVFNFDCIKSKKFHIKNSPGQSGALGNILLKKYFFLRTPHPVYSFLYFGNNPNKYQTINSSSGTNKNSLWKYFIEDKFDLITLGHHYSRSFTHVHYIEDLLKVDYRFNLKFPLAYTNKKNISVKKNYTFFARKKRVCDFSGMTKKCDSLFFKEKVARFCKFKDLISFKLNISQASNLLYENLEKNSEDLISYIRTNKQNKNVLCSYDGSISDLEKYYLKIK